MAQSGEVDDDLKDEAHVIPMDIWQKIRAEVESDGS